LDHDNEENDQRFSFLLKSPQLPRILGVRVNLSHCETAFSTFLSLGSSTSIGIKFAIPDDLCVGWRSVE
jgi:hypothetical protein